jgi:ribosomal protein S18
MVKMGFKDPTLNLDDIETINYKDTKFLSNFISEQGKILPRRSTKLIKRARIAALLPFVIGKV